MPWSIVRVYTLPQPAVVDLLKSIPEVEEMYLVNDLDGISDHERKLVFSEVPTEYSHMRHGLPNGGLLAIVPDVDTGYYGEPDRRRKRVALTNDYGTIKELPEVLNLNISHFNLFYSLKQLHDQTGVPIMYYQCAIWGGAPDDELAVVFDNGMFVYRYNTETKKNVQVIDNQDFEIQTSVLQKGLEHLGLSLPTQYFALHTSPFDWGRYSIDQ
jgi:hypothetical protein